MAKAASAEYVKGVKTPKTKRSVGHGRTVRMPSNTL